MSGEENWHTRLPQCPMDVTLHVVDGKWKLFIIWTLRQGTLRFNELKRRLPQVTQKMLTQQLRELERDGIIRRTVYAQVPPRVEYSLAEWGEKLEPVLAMLCQWGEEYRQSRYEMDAAGQNPVMAAKPSDPT